MSFQSPTRLASPTDPPGAPPNRSSTRADLTGAEGTAFIVLDDKTYTLRITKAGKLILTK
jgi:hemin uptake protein HemP